MSSPFTIFTNDVHVWRFDLLADSTTQDRCWQILAEAEQQRASRFHFERDRRRFVVRRAILRQILAIHLDCAAPMIEFIAGPGGKPEIGGTTESGKLQFSCSHSEDVGLVAVGHERALGVDIEVHRSLDWNLEAVTGYFAPVERDELYRVRPEHRTQAFFDCWTCKEAFVKALGLGLSMPLDRFVVSAAPGAKPRLVSLEGDPNAGERWQLLMLDVGSGCSAALVVEGGPAKVDSRIWKPEPCPCS